MIGGHIKMKKLRMGILLSILIFLVVLLVIGILHYFDAQAIH
jgi:hypothetical protein